MPHGMRLGLSLFLQVDIFFQFSQAIAEWDGFKGLQLLYSKEVLDYGLKEVKLWEQ